MGKDYGNFYYDSKGRLMVRRNIVPTPENYYEALTGFNLNTRTMQLGGWKYNYADFVRHVGQLTADEVIAELTKVLGDYTK